MASCRTSDTNRRDRRAFLQAAGATAAVLLVGNLPFAALAQGGGTAKLKIGTLGSGRVGSAIGGAWVIAGHEVMFSSLNLEADRKLAASARPRRFAKWPPPSSKPGVPFERMTGSGRQERLGV